jgi:hypothetical protein
VQEVVAVPGRGAVVVSPGRSVTLEWEAGSPHLLVWFDRDALETALQQTMGRRPTGGLRFDLGIDLTSPPLRRWLQIVNLVRQEVEHGPQVATHPAVVPVLVEVQEHEAPGEEGFERPFAKAPFRLVSAVAMASAPMRLTTVAPQARDHETAPYLAWRDRPQATGSRWMCRVWPTTGGPESPGMSLRTVMCGACLGWERARCPRGR